MNEAQKEELRNYLRQLDATQTLAWITRVWAGEVDSPTYTNWWLGIAERATFDASEMLDLTWARVATAIYEHLNSQRPPGKFSSALLSSMHLRAYMIRNLGAVRGDPILDSEVIARLFLDNLDNVSITYERALAFAEANAPSGTEHEDQGLTIRNDEAWEALSRAEQLGYLEIIAELKVIQSLIDDGLLSPSQELSAWLHILGKRA